MVIGWLGSVYDVRVFFNLEIYNCGCNGDFFDFNIKEIIFGIDIVFVIFGDFVYFFLDWLIKVYLEN